MSGGSKVKLLCLKAVPITQFHAVKLSFSASVSNVFKWAKGRVVWEFLNLQNNGHFSTSIVFWMYLILFQPVNMFVSMEVNLILICWLFYVMSVIDYLFCKPWILRGSLQTKVHYNGLYLLCKTEHFWKILLCLVAYFIPNFKGWCVIFLVY